MKDRHVLTAIGVLLAIGPVYPQNFQLDPDFGIDGVIYKHEPSWANGTLPLRINQLPTGELIVLEWIGVATAMVVRHLPNGEVDPTFGDSGYFFSETPGVNLMPSGLMIQPDGKIIVSGSGSVVGENPRIVLFRLLPNGTLDTSFGVDGYTQYTVSTFHQLFTAALQPDGKVLVAGGAASSFMVCRIGSDGAVDQTFATNGVGLYTPPGLATSARCMRVDENGGIFLGGHRSQGFDPSSQVVMKLTPAGQFDPTFGVNGCVVIDHVPNAATGPSKPESVKDLYINTDGSVIVAGYVALPDTWENLAVVKLLPNGDRDLEFGENGALYMSNSPEDRAHAEQLFYDPTGQFILIGRNTPPGAVGFSIMLVRFDPQGNVINAHDNNGVFLHQTAVPSTIAVRGTLDNQGRVIIGNGYVNRPIGKASLTCFTLNSILGSEGEARETTPTKLWPNPTCGSLTIQYAMNNSAPVSIDLLDTSGRLVERLVSGSHRTSGSHQEALVISPEVASGNYHVRLLHEGSTSVYPVTVTQ